MNNIVLDSDKAIQFACKYPREVWTEAHYDVSAKGEDIEEISEGVLKYEMTVTDAVEAGGMVDVQISPLHSFKFAAKYDILSFISFRRTSSPGPSKVWIPDIDKPCVTQFLVSAIVQYHLEPMNFI